MSSKSALLTSDIVQAAFDNLREEIEAFIKTQKDRKALCFHVLDPCSTIARLSAPVVLWHGIAGDQDPANWGSNYVSNADKKARLVWRTGYPTSVVKKVYPHLFEEGDFKYGGGIIYNGIIVGASGLSEAQDEEFATELASRCYKLVLPAAKIELEKPGRHILEKVSESAVTPVGGA